MYHIFLYEKISESLIEIQIQSSIEVSALAILSNYFIKFFSVNQIAENSNKKEGIKFLWQKNQ